MTVWQEFFKIFATRVRATHSTNHHLDRIASALERIAPSVEEEAEEIKPDDAVTYVDEEKLARQEQIDQAGELARWLEEHPEFAEDARTESEP